MTDYAHMTDTTDDIIIVEQIGPGWGIRVRGALIWATRNYTQAQTIAEFLEYHIAAAETAAALVRAA